jgi:Putative Actinobacterial Holin-X, holin superfamily III
VTETTDSVAAPPEEETEEQEAESLNELAVQLGHDVSVLAFCEAQLATARHMPEVRRTARDLVAAVLAGVAFVTAFVFLNVAAMLGLSSAVSSWLAAVILALVWVALGTVLAIALMVRAGHVSGWKWWRVFTAGPEETLKDLERARDEAEEAVRETLARLAPVITVEIASAAMPMAGEMADGVVDAAGGILEASDDAVEAIADDLPGGSVVNQMWDVVLMPGRFGLRVATTVLKRDES